VSVQLIHNDHIEKSSDMKKNRKNKKKEMQEICKNMSITEKEKYKEELKKVKKLDQVKIKLKNKELTDKMKAEYKKLSKEEKLAVRKKITDEKKLKKLTNKEYIEFPYLEELNEKEKEELKNSNWVVVDPGKKNLVYLKNKKGTKLRYSNRSHLVKTKRLKYQALLKNYKNKNNILKLEQQLSKFNSKTCDYLKFKTYIKNKNIIVAVLFERYKHKIFRQYKWYGYINRKKAESDLVKNIKKSFGKNVTLVYGDWSIGKDLRGFISTPNLGLKRKLGEHFKIYSLDEFRTSMLNCKTEEKNDNLYYTDKKNKIRKLHSVLTYQTQSNRLGCINRDLNAVNNMVKLVDHYLNNDGSLTENRPEKFRRNFKLEETVKQQKSPTLNQKVKPAKCMRQAPRVQLHTDDFSVFNDMAIRNHFKHVNFIKSVV
jgi:hypothetical protein